MSGELLIPNLIIVESLLAKCINLIDGLIIRVRCQSLSKTLAFQTKSYQ